MKFDAIIGNPPYQDMNVGNNNQAAPIYHHFYEMAEKYSEKYIIISPARFLFNQGATPKAWNEKMLNDTNISIKKFYFNSNTVFPNTNITGGIAIILKDKSKDFGRIDTFIPYDELRNIFIKVTNKNKENKVLADILYSPDSYKFSDLLFEENPNLIGITDKSHAKAMSSNVFSRYPIIFFENIQVETEGDYAKIFGRYLNDRKYFWVKKDYIANHNNFNKWKVFIPGANGSHPINPLTSTSLIGEPELAKPYTGHTQTFLSLGAYNTKFEALSLFKYVKTKFARSLLGIKKTTQNNQSKNTWSVVPLQDFTENSDIDWSKSISEIDKQLYIKYGLEENEIIFIEEHINEME